MIVCRYGHLRAPDNQTGYCRRCAREREAREELAKERAESRERTALVLDAAIERSRIREANHTPGWVPPWLAKKKGMKTTMNSRYRGRKS